MILVILNYFRNIKGLLDEVLIKSEFLKLLWVYFFRYEWNNVYLNLFESLIKYLIENSHHFKEIIKYLFSELKIIDYIYSKSQNISFSFASERTINRGYWASMVDICKKINDSADNEILTHLNSKQIIKINNINNNIIFINNLLFTLY